VKYVVDVNGERKQVDLSADGVTYETSAQIEAELLEIEASPLMVLRIGNEVHRVVVQRGTSRGRYSVWIDGYRFDLEALDERTRQIRDVAAASAPASGPAPIVAPMPGLVVRVRVAVGDKVEAGQGVVVMEAMKMENELRAKAAGTVRSIEVEPGTAVEKGTLLVSLE
jgi:pyruvate carboxylase subunit B